MSIIDPVLFTVNVAEKLPVVALIVPLSYPVPASVITTERIALDE